MGVVADIGVAVTPDTAHTDGLRTQDSGDNIACESLRILPITPMILKMYRDTVWDMLGAALDTKRMVTRFKVGALRGGEAELQ